MDSAQARQPRTPPASSSVTAETTLALVDAPSRDKVEQHPQISSLLSKGWTIRSANPRIVEAEGARWLVVLKRPPRTEAIPHPSGDALTAQSRREQRVCKRPEPAADPAPPKRSPSAQDR